MNKAILTTEVQAYLDAHLKDDVHRVAMSTSPFAYVSSQELAGQIAARNKAEKKLPTWFKTANIYYPQLLSIEQCSSEKTAEYKSSLIKGDHVLDLTGGFGVDSFYFSKVAEEVKHSELIADLSAVAKHNAEQLGVENIEFLNVDGISYLQTTEEQFSTIYIDPARRGKSGKVFMLRDCSPDVVANMDLLRSRASRLIIKTSPLLDISAGIKELQNVSEVQIISVKNECKELLFILDSVIDQSTAKKTGLITGDQAENTDEAVSLNSRMHFESPSSVKITCVTMNEQVKSITFQRGSGAEDLNTLAQDPIYEGNAEAVINEATPSALLVNAQVKRYLYEPDVALLKSGAFNEIALIYNLKKLDLQTQLYTSDEIEKEFPGRIFEIKESMTKNEMKKQRILTGNVIVRNYPGKPEELIKAFKIKPSREEFLIFTKINKVGYLILKASILQHY